jgi:hypothetical protein
MTQRWTAALAMLVLALAAPAVWSADPVPEADPENAAIARVIDDSIGWFKTKDFDLMFSTLAHDPALFMFQPDSGSTIQSFEEFEKYSEIYRNPDVRYARHEIRELRIHRSRSGDVAWFSAILDDCSESKGKVGCWQDTRWTGVLEKRDGRWVILQMHFSFAVDKIIERLKQQAGPKQ